MIVYLSHTQLIKLFYLYPLNYIRLLRIISIKTYEQKGRFVEYKRFIPKLITGWKVAIAYITYLHPLEVTLFLEVVFCRVRVCLLVCLGSQFTAEHCPDSLDSLPLFWVFRESEVGGMGDCDCQGLHNCEWRNALPLGLRHILAADTTRTESGMEKNNNKMKEETNQWLNKKCSVFLLYNACSCVLILSRIILE